MSNEQLREHVTSVGFALTLTKNQIDTLVLMHYHGGFNKFHNATRPHRISHNYVSTAHALIRRGLFRSRQPGQCEICATPYCDHHITKAGVLVADLLKEAGIYQDVLDRYGYNESTLKEQTA